MVIKRSVVMSSGVDWNPRKVLLSLEDLKQSCAFRSLRRARSDAGKGSRLELSDSQMSIARRMYYNRDRVEDIVDTLGLHVSATGLQKYLKRQGCIRGPKPIDDADFKE